jgi:hypothetical protein
MVNMKKIICIVLFCALFAGCTNGVYKDEKSDNTETMSSKLENGTYMPIKCENFEASPIEKKELGINMDKITLDENVIIEIAFDLQKYLHKGYFDEPRQYTIYFDEKYKAYRIGFYTLPVTMGDFTTMIISSNGELLAYWEGE